MLICTHAALLARDQPDRSAPAPVFHPPGNRSRAGRGVSDQGSGPSGGRAAEPASTARARELRRSNAAISARGGKTAAHKGPKERRHHVRKLQRVSLWQAKSTPPTKARVRFLAIPRSSTPC